MSSKPWVGKSVVIIDDSATVRQELKSVFEACGMTVVGMGENGVIGLDLVANKNPEVVSIDLIMPEMDGVECYKKMQEHHASVKCIMVSWIGGEAKILENLKDIIPSHLFQAKPVAQKDLEDRLEAVYFPHMAAKTALKAAEEDPTADLMDLGIKVS